MNASKIIKGVVGGGRYTVTAPIIKEDYGLYLKIEGLELPGVAKTVRRCERGISDKRYGCIEMRT